MMSSNKITTVSTSQVVCREFDSVMHGTAEWRTGRMKHTGGNVKRDKEEKSHRGQVLFYNVT